MIRSILALLPLILAASPSVAAPRRQSEAETQMARVVASFDKIYTGDAILEQPQRVAAALAALPAHRPGPEMPVLAIGGSGWQAIFDREAQRAANVFASRHGGPTLVISNTAAQAKSGLLASRGTIALAVAGFGARQRKGDTLIVYLTSHGGEAANIQMDGPGLDFADLTAADLARALDKAGLKRRIIIVSACFGASWIKPLAGAETIVMAAAAADRTSFGCDDSRQLTLFGETLLGEIARPQSLATAFAAAKARITATERRLRITPSLPQAYVGDAMQTLWSAAPAGPLPHQ